MNLQAPQFDVNDLHAEYTQQIAMLSQRAAMLAANNNAMTRAYQASQARIKELEDEIAALRSGPVPG